MTESTPLPLGVGPASGPLDRRETVRSIILLLRKIRRALELRDPSPWLRLSLTRGQLRIAFLLSVHGPMSPGAVAAALRVPKANVTTIIESMVRQKLVTREQDPQDRRAQILTITESGRNQFEQLREWRDSRMEKVLGEMMDTELADLARCLTALLGAAGRQSPAQESGNPASGSGQPEKE